MLDLREMEDFLRGLGCKLMTSQGERSWFDLPKWVTKRKQARRMIKSLRQVIPDELMLFADTEEVFGFVLMPSQVPASSEIEEAKAKLRRERAAKMVEELVARKAKAKEQNGERWEIGLCNSPNSKATELVGPFHTKKAASTEAKARNGGVSESWPQWVMAQVGVMKRVAPKENDASKDFINNKVQEFDKAWEALAQEGTCDGILGQEHSRVLKSWIDCGMPSNIKEFISRKANSVPQDDGAEIQAALAEVKDRISAMGHKHFSSNG